MKPTKTKSHPFFFGVLLGAVALFSGCETDNGIASRAREKPDTYANLQLWQKRFIEKGVIAKGFTTDMVYIAMGHPTKVQVKEIPEGHAELWTYKNYYPNEMQATMGGYRSADFTRESPYQPQFKTNKNGSSGFGNGGEPVWMSTPESIFVTGPPQGGSMEPADLQSYTYMVLLLNGKVVRFYAGYNP